MKDHREMLEKQLNSYEKRLVEFNSFIKKLGDRALECGTERSHFKEDLTEAEHNVKYYEGGSHG